MIGNGALFEQVEIRAVKTRQTAATGDVTSDVVDMAGYDGVAFLTNYETAAANNVMHVEQSSDNAVADAYADVAGSEADLSGSPETYQITDILKPQERYCRAVAQRGTSSALGVIYALLYRAKEWPVTQGSGIAAKILPNPAEGTK